MKSLWPERPGIPRVSAQIINELKGASDGQKKFWTSTFQIEQQELYGGLLAMAEHMLPVEATPVLMHELSFSYLALRASLASPIPIVTNWMRYVKTKNTDMVAAMDRGTDGLTPQERFAGFQPGLYRHFDNYTSTTSPFDANSGQAGMVMTIVACQYDALEWQIHQNSISEPGSADGA